MDINERKELMDAHERDLRRMEESYKAEISTLRNALFDINQVKQVIQKRGGIDHVLQVIDVQDTPNGMIIRVGRALRGRVD